MTLTIRGMKQRDDFIDVAKGLCILFVVTIHTELFGVLGTPYPVLAVPFFFFMSGFYDRPQLRFQELLKNNWKRLLLPTFIWMLIAYIHRSAMYYMGHGGIQFNFSWTNPIFANGAAWFIFALFYAKLIMWGVSRLRLPKFAESILVLCLGMLGCWHEMPMLLDEGLSALPLYYIGKVLYPSIKERINNKLLIVIGAIAFASILSPLYPYVLVPMRTEGMLLWYPLMFAIAVMSFFFFLFTSNLLKTCKWLSLYGQHTFGILLTHCIFLHTFAVIFNRTLGNGTPIWILAFALAYIFTCWASFKISRLCEKYIPLLIGKKK